VILIKASFVLGVIIHEVKSPIYKEGSKYTLLFEVGLLSAVYTLVC